MQTNIFNFQRQNTKEYDPNQTYPKVTLQEIEIFPTPKNVGESEKHVEKGSPNAVLGVGQTSGEVSRDRISRRCTGHASRKPLLTPSFPMQSTTSGKPRLLSRLHGDKRDPEKVIMEREELERQQREEKALLQAEANTAEDARRKAEAEVAAAARDGNDDGTDGSELRTTTNVSLFSEPFPFRFQFCVE
uniref:Uncharacterized protein n=1 Tax=Cucumis melo TaxID=3656 RepID=A0A9I9E7F2_CUCME